MTTQKTIIKSFPRVSFTIIPNALAQDRRLSFDERGMLAYLLSRPETWEISPTDLANEGGIGTQKVQKMLKHLIELGYCTRERIRDEQTKRFTDIVYTVFDTPQIEKPHVEKPRVENHPQVSKESSFSKKDSFAPDKPTPAPIEQSPKKERPRNEHFDAIVSAFGYQVVPKSQASLIGKVANELKDAGVTPEQVNTIYLYCKGKFETFSAKALATHAGDALAKKPTASKWREA